MYIFDITGPVTTCTALASQYIVHEDNFENPAKSGQQNML